MGQFVAFGEIMLRLSRHNRELLLQTPRLDVWTAGAEANVATAPARLGHDVAPAAVLPENGLGDAALAGLGNHDAFAARALHARRLGQGIECVAADKLALTCLKYSLPGDASLFGRAELHTLVTGDADVRR